MNRTSIEYCDYTWNPITGCLGGCYYCYARTLSHRFGWGFEPTFHEERLRQPAKLKKPSKIFVVSMGDLFGDEVPDAWIDKVFRAMEAAPWHTYQLLSKRPERMVYYVSPGVPHYWLGATATDQESWDDAVHWLSMRLRQRIKPDACWISAEPVLAEIDPRLPEPDSIQPDWVVIGAQTGCKDIMWAESAWFARILKQRLIHLGVPVFEKGSLQSREPVRQWPQIRRKW